MPRPACLGRGVPAGHRFRPAIDLQHPAAAHIGEASRQEIGLAQQLRHEGFCRPAVELHRLPLLQQPTVPQNRQLICHRRGLVLVMGHPDGGEAQPAQDSIYARQQRELRKRCSTNIRGKRKDLASDSRSVAPAMGSSSLAQW
jgi:hypothetical protein